MKLAHIILFYLIVLQTAAVAQQKAAIPTPADQAHFLQAFSEERQRRDTVASRSISPNFRNLEQQYSTFLKSKGTGLFVLPNPKPCTLKIESRILNSNDLDNLARKCPTRYFPSGAKHYSFRTRTYVHPSNADISFEKGLIYSGALLSHGILVNLGSMSLESVDLDTNGIRFLRDYVPSVSASEADQQQVLIEKGIERNGFFYVKALSPVVGTTYAIRVITYRAELPESIIRPEPGVVFDRLDNENRADVLVAFRIVSSDEYGLAILWEELFRRQSPTIRK